MFLTFVWILPFGIGLFASSSEAANNDVARSSTAAHACVRASACNVVTVRGRCVRVVEEERVVEDEAE